jgi:predicted AAA+ superfamily ATPase
MYTRLLEAQLRKILKSGKSVLLLGPRQVGKTTICRKIKFDIEINLASITEKNRFEKDPTLLEKMISEQKSKVLVYVDEIQKIPELFNSVQLLIDKNKAQFVLTGSSARKIKKQTDINLAPGRLRNLRLDPLTISENKVGLDEILVFGQLPAIATENDKEEKELSLRSYVENYIEEEIRKETRLRNVAPFFRFLEAAAIQSGKITNFSQISKELGPTVVTIQSYYQILEDTLFVDRIDPYLKNASRKKIAKSSKHLFFDLGVRRILSEEGRIFLPERKGELFEHWVGNEIIKWIRLNSRKAKLYYWRDNDGPEVDWLLEQDNRLLPIEVKLSSNPGKSAIKHIQVFQNEYPSAKTGLVICTTEIKYKLDKTIDAIPYQDLHKYLDLWGKF